MVKLNPLRWLAKPEPEKPKTFDSKVAGSKHTFFDKKDQDLTKCRHVYEQGGVVSEAIDCHPLFMFSNGYKFDGPENLVKQVQAQHDKIDFETIGWKLAVDSLVVKKGIAEIAQARGYDGGAPMDPKKPAIAALYYRSGEQFTEIYDDYSQLVGYKQVSVTNGRKVELIHKPEYIFKLDLGLPLVSRCMDDIIRDTEIVDSTAASIKRHGYPRYHVKVGLTGQTMPDTVLSTMGSQFEELEADHEWVTPRDVDIVNIDTTGIQNTKLYGDWAIQRLCAALGAPEEMLGLGRGSTEATANVRLQAWYDRISTLQHRFAAQWNAQIVDRMTGKEGLVRLVFNDPNPTDDVLKAQTVASLLGLGVSSPITLNEARAMLGLQPLPEFEDNGDYRPEGPPDKAKPEKDAEGADDE